MRGPGPIRTERGRQLGLVGPCRSLSKAEPCWGEAGRAALAGAERQPGVKVAAPGSTAARRRG